MASFSGLSSKATKRGYSTCASCKETYPAKRKPKVCKCGEELGGSFKETAPTAEISPPCVVVFRYVLHTCAIELLSCRTSGRDTRVFVLYSDQANERLCYQTKCKELRSTMLASGKLSDFTCKHLELVKQKVEPIYCRSFSEDEVDCFTPDKNTTHKMKRHQRPGMPTVVKITERSYAVMGEDSTSAPMGYVHVTLNGTKNIVQCTNDPCRRRPDRLKHGGKLQICLHIHYALLARRLSEGIQPQPANTDVVSEDIEIEQNRPYQLSWEEDLEEKHLQRSSTLKLQMKITLPYKIPCEILKLSIPSCNPGHLVYFAPEISKCSLCNSDLGEPVLPRGCAGKDGNGILLTHQRPFEKCTIKVRICQSASCMAVNQVFPYKSGLFNICNKIMIELLILMEWRECLKKGIPVSYFVEIKLNSLLLTLEHENRPSGAELDYLSQLLYNGFYGFESITERNLDDVVCGICGTVGEMYLGDGNEKNCCSLREVDMKNTGASLPVKEDSVHLENILQKIKLRFVERCCFANSKLDFIIRMNQIPPVIPPALRKHEINSETDKKSVYLTKTNDGQDGDPVLLAQIFKQQGITLAALDSMDKESLKKIAKDCKVTTTSKSMEMIRASLRALYATILVGTSPCHGFNKSPGHTGGFYHLVCRHSCTVASKFMILTESVRDAGDLYLSLKFPPVTFIYDTACTFVRHMNNREPEISSKIWGNFDGCFEIPSQEKKPNTNMNVPELVPSEYLTRPRKLTDRAKWDEYTHPVSMNSRRYVLGDRFHTAVKPHKSPLCLYHDINNCAQANTLKTSFQEAENSRKNRQRLRSACNQNFHTHFFYNVLMDFYQNEKIVLQQIETIKKSTGKEPHRDEYLRFVV